MSNPSEEQIKRLLELYAKEDENLSYEEAREICVRLLDFLGILTEISQRIDIKDFPELAIQDEILDPIFESNDYP